MDHAPNSLCLARPVGHTPSFGPLAFTIVSPFHP